MSLSDNLRRLAEEADINNRRLQEELGKLNAADFAEENRKLKEALADSEAAAKKLREASDKLYEENVRLKNTLYDKLFDEKMRILEAVNSRIEDYYTANSLKEMNRLKEFELKSHGRIYAIVNEMRRNNISLEDELFKKASELEALLKQKVEEARQNYLKSGGAFADNKREQYDKLHGEAVTEEEKAQALKKRNVESIIGLNIFNKAGFIFLLIGIITGVNFIYAYMDDIYKSLLLFGIGAVLIGIGEFLHRKKPNVFSQGTTGAGIAVWILAIGISFFWLKLFNAYAAISISVAITAIAFLLSMRYNSETVASFALIGGFLPFSYIITSGEAVYPILAYFLILNIFALIISFRKKWSIMGYLSYAFNFLGCVFLLIWGGQMYAYEPKETSILPNALILIYFIMVFVSYSLMPTVYNMRMKRAFTKADIIMLAINTAVSAIFLYIQLNFTYLHDFTGLFSVIMCAAYLTFGVLTAKSLPLEKKVRDLFYLTGCAFLILFVPFQLDMAWFSLGWLIEAVLLIIVGVFRNYRSFISIGFIILCICGASFLIFNVIGNMIDTDAHFFFKYFAITAGFTAVTASYIIKKRPVEEPINFFNYIAAVNLWVFAIYFSVDKVTELLYASTYMSPSYLTHSLAIALSFVIAYFLPRIRFLRDDVIKGISFFIYAVSILWIFILNIIYSPFELRSVPGEYVLLGTIILIIINGLAVFAMHDFVKALVLERKLGAEWYPLAVSAFFIVLLTETLISHYELAINNFIISIIYIVAAFAWIILGFIRRYSFIRRFGLALSFLAIAKLFLIDLYELTEGYRIITYFIFGIILIAISFVYQYFSKHLELKPETVKEIQPKNPPDAPTDVRSSKG